MKKLKFHLISSLTNFILVFLLYKLHSYIIDKFIDKLFFIRIEENFSFIYLTSLLVISFISTFLIYIVNDYRKHFYILLLLMLLITFSLILYDLIIKYDEMIEYYQSFFDYLRKRTFYILIKEETLIASILISGTIYYSQMKLGKKLLPNLYTDTTTKIK